MTPQLRRSALLIARVQQASKAARLHHAKLTKAIASRHDALIGASEQLRQSLRTCADPEQREALEGQYDETIRDKARHSVQLGVANALQVPRDN